MQYVNTEIFPRSIGRSIKKASIIREASDYEDFYIATKEEAEEQIILANTIIKLVEEYINNQKD